MPTAAQPDAPSATLDAARLAAMRRCEPMQLGDAAQLRAGEVADQDPVLREGALGIALEEAVGGGAEKRSRRVCGSSRRGGPDSARDRRARAGE